MDDVWAARPDGVEIGIRAFEESHPVHSLRGAFAVVVRPGPGREFVVFGPGTYAQAAQAARKVWTDHPRSDS